MSKDEAQSVLNQFASGHAPADACTNEGRLLLRSAAHSYAEALDREGRTWPDLPGLLGGAETSSDDISFSNLDAFVLGAVIAGFIEPSDLRGPGGQISAFIRSRAATDPAAPVTPDQLQYACSEVFALHQASARLALVAERYRRAEERAEAREDWRRKHELQERYAPRIVRGRREIERLERALEKKVAEARERDSAS